MFTSPLHARNACVCFPSTCSNTQVTMYGLNKAHAALAQIVTKTAHNEFVTGLATSTWSSNVYSVSWDHTCQMHSFG